MFVNETVQSTSYRTIWLVISQNNLPGDFIGGGNEPEVVKAVFQLCSEEY